MRRILSLVGMAATLVALAGSPASAAVQGTTTLVGSALAGEPLTVTASITSATPIAPYEYSIENMCWFSGHYSGHFDSSERFDIAGPWFDVGGFPTTTVQVNLNDVPSGSACKVSIARGPTIVKGSTTPYTVS